MVAKEVPVEDSKEEAVVDSAEEAVVDSEAEDPKAALLSFPSSPPPSVEGIFYWTDDWR